MPDFAANIDWLFTEHRFPDRFAMASAAGFSAVECSAPYQMDVSEIRKRLRRYGLKLAVIDTPPAADGMLGLGAVPGRSADFLDGVRRAVDMAAELSCPLVHAVAGVVEGDITHDVACSVFIENLSKAVEIAAAADIVLTLEPINPFDIAGYFLNRTGDAVAIINQIDSPNLRLQLDFYHRQMLEGSLTEAWEEHRNLIAHIQIAGLPGRHEPDDGEIWYPHLFDRLDRDGYTGWVGCEYSPRGKTLEGLRWASRWGIGLVVQSPRAQ